MTDGQNHCRLTSLLPMSCQSRAEAFVRRLHSRLRSIGSQDDSTETTWLGNPEISPVTSLQPRQSPEKFLDYDDLYEAPSSPPEHQDESDYITNSSDDLSTDLIKQNSEDSSDLSTNGYFDPESPENLKNDFTTNTKQEVDPNLSNGFISSNYSTKLDGESKITEDSTRNIIEDDVFLSLDDEITTNITKSNDENVFIPSEVALTNEESKFEPLLTENKLNWSLNYSPHIQPNHLFNAIDLNSIKTNTETKDDKNDELYCSQLNIEPNLIIECPVVPTDDIIPRIEVSTLEINQETPENKSNHLQVNCLNFEDDLEEHTPRVRRCSSLKTGKTPPGTPGRKKIVRFADVLGLDLADVRTFLDEIPKIPISAYDDLSDLDLPAAKTEPTKTLIPLFDQPGGQVNFLDRVRERQVCLENAVLQDPSLLCVCGTIRVRNLDFNKSVHVRYTTDEWKNFADLQATYIENSCDGFSDKFTFTLYAHTLSIGRKLEFAVRFQCKGAQYWDNNGGANYCFQCIPVEKTPATYIPFAVPYENNWGGATFYYDEKILHTTVQEIVTQNLIENKTTPISGEMMIALILLFFACIFIFIQKIIYLMSA